MILDASHDVIVCTFDVFIDITLIEILMIKMLSIINDETSMNSKQDSKWIVRKHIYTTFGNKVCLQFFLNNFNKFKLTFFTIFGKFGKLKPWLCRFFHEAWIDFFACHPVEICIIYFALWFPTSSAKTLMMWFYAARYIYECDV